MKIYRSPSYSYPLGEIDPGWHQPEFDTNLRATLVYTSHDTNGDTTYPCEKIKTDLPDELNPAMIGNLRPAIRSIDELIRDHRGYDSTTPTEIKTEYRVGTGRATGPGGQLLHYLIRLAGNPPFFFTPLSGVHYDELDIRDNPAEDPILLSHRGTPTITYEGPVYNVNPRSNETPHSDAEVLGIIASALFLTKIFRLSAPLRVVQPRDTAVLTTADRTMHRQATQLYRPSKPPAFLKIVVSPQPLDKVPDTTPS